MIGIVFKVSEHEESQGLKHDFEVNESCLQNSSDLATSWIRCNLATFRDNFDLIVLALLRDMTPWFNEVWGRQKQSCMSCSGLCDSHLH